MDKRALNHTVAKAVRVEYDSKSDSIFLVFEVTDERLKQQVKKDWMQDIELVLIGRNLVKEKGE